MLNYQLLNVIFILYFLKLTLMVKSGKRKANAYMKLKIWIIF